MQNGAGRIVWNEGDRDYFGWQGLTKQSKAAFSAQPSAFRLSGGGGGLVVSPVSEA